MKGSVQPLKSNSSNKWSNNQARENAVNTQRERKNKANRENADSTIHHKDEYCLRYNISADCCKLLLSPHSVFVSSRPGFVTAVAVHLRLQEKALQVFCYQIVHAYFRHNCEVQKVNISFITSVRLPSLVHGTAPLMLNGFV